MTTNTVRQSPWIRRFREVPGASVRLVCFPHAGGSATFFFPLAEALTPQVEVIAVQYPGRQDRYREPCVNDMTELVEQSLEALLPWTDRPLTLLGHSMGATVAFEVARRMEARGIVPRALLASGRRAPTCAPGTGIAALDDRSLLAELELLHGTDARLFQDEELLGMVMPAIRSDYEALEGYRYQPGPALSCPVVALTGDHDRRVSLDQARAWSDVAGTAFDLQVFSGGHFFLGDRTAEVADVVRGVLGC
ncbi:alpha/beta fold hydrolase [Streptomyces sp. ISL-12]|uniref:thioesterase II family protein n=1 Tax=Streptomyces sp. ISL-12 TaxID=2819177 RepID=UPI0027DF6D66|nr:alpha/beta fold hydrolase [Streptomyces sp. ISL-12]